MSVETVSTANAPGQGYSKRRVSLIVGVLSLAIFMSSLDLFIVNLAFPYVSKDFHAAELPIIVVVVLALAFGLWHRVRTVRRHNAS